MNARGRWRFCGMRRGGALFLFWEWIGLVGIGEVGVMGRGDVWWGL